MSVKEKISSDPKQKTEATVPVAAPVPDASHRKASRGNVHLAGSLFRHVTQGMRSQIRGRLRGGSLKFVEPDGDVASHSSEMAWASNNPLEQYFDAHAVGPGIWKWRHYFDVYHRHFQKFIGREVHILEIGVYSGGSLDMWKQYFGPGCIVYGVDNQPECKVYENERTKIFIGDQADRGFWRDTLRQIPRVDIIIDDGGHQPHQQIATLEETLPALAPGGVYICEDLHGGNHEFTSYVYGLSHGLNTWRDKHEELFASWRTPFQQFVHSVHLYPFMVVIEKTADHQDSFEAPKHGTEWQPFGEKWGF